MKHFTPSEILTPEYGNSEYWLNRLMRPTILTIADAYREEFGKTFINTPWNGLYKDSGFRSIASFQRMYPEKFIKDYDEWRSAHPRGAGIDTKAQETEPKDAFEDILNNSKYWFSLGLRRLEAMELTTGKYNDWNHLDTLETGHDDLVVVTYTESYTIEEYRKIRHKI